MVLNKQNIPNVITLFRIACAPLLILIMALDGPWAGVWAAAVFILASLSDYFDGKLARQWGVTSHFGKLMDPVADKVLVTSTLIMLIPTGRLDVYMVMILISRDTIVDGIRSAAAADRIIIPAGAVGKWKTAIQMIAIPAVLIHETYFGIPLSRIGYGILWISVALSVISGMGYVVDYFKRKL
jgi:CDP-diacylglycerol--glycerol-3-phosphate 3-phosphatidyltransferase